MILLYSLYFGVGICCGLDAGKGQPGRGRLATPCSLHARLEEDFRTWLVLSVCDHGIAQSVWDVHRSNGKCACCMEVHGLWTRNGQKCEYSESKYCFDVRSKRWYLSAWTMYGTPLPTFGGFILTVIFFQIEIRLDGIWSIRLENTGGERSEPWIATIK